jgi:hypothetical protein
VEQVPAEVVEHGVAAREQAGQLAIVPRDQEEARHEVVVGAEDEPAHAAHGVLPVVAEEAPVVGLVVGLEVHVQPRRRRVPGPLAAAQRVAEALPGADIETLDVPDGEVFLLEPGNGSQKMSLRSSPGWWTRRTRSVSSA